MSEFNASITVVPIPAEFVDKHPKDEYITPIKAIHNHMDFEQFKKSSNYEDILNTVKDCAEAIVDIPNSKEDLVVSPIVQHLVDLFNTLYHLVEEIPPIKQPMRFGNKAFRTWHSQLTDKVNHFCDQILPENKKAASIEIIPYFLDMFGNSTRIDYGTGHELNFVIVTLILTKLGLITKADYPAMIIRGFVAYIKVMRKLQTDYMLEPAGSHGVWGLDDYHCLLFLWGAAQLSKQSEIRPSSVHDKSLLREMSSEYIYLEGIDFIMKIKSSAPFAETSPMLNDISHMNDWVRICSGLMSLFQGEVLNKFPVIQHLLFGHIFKCSWK